MNKSGYHPLHNEKNKTDKDPEGTDKSGSSAAEQPADTPEKKVHQGSPWQLKFLPKSKLLTIER